MSIVAWDGRSMAADKLCVSADMRTTSTKLVRLQSGVLLAWVGESGGGKALLDWYLGGGMRDKWPDAQKTENWTRLIVAENGYVSFYEREPFSQRVEESFMAWGSGRDFAMGAMAMGASAKEAVEVASRFSTTCGNGVDCFPYPAEMVSRA